MLAQTRNNDLLVYAVVLDEEGTASIFGFVLIRRSDRTGNVSRGGSGRQRDPEPEGRAQAGFALDADFSAHEFRELLRNGEAEAGATKTPRHGSVGLREWGKKVALRAPGNANA